MTSTRTLATMTPAEVDALLAPHSTEQARQMATAWDYLARARKTRSDSVAEHYRAEADKATARAATAGELAEPFRTEYDRRGGWPRIFWCTSNGGHAHRSTHCSTLRPTTGMVWLPDLSGTDEAQLVELAGAAACTVCYPSAPVDALARPSQLRPAVEEREAKAARAAERQAAAAVKAAKAITMPDGSPLRVGYSEARTVVSAWREGAAAVADLLGYGTTHPSAGDWARFADAAAEALAAKLGRPVTEVRAEIQTKGEAKHARDWK